MSTNRESEAGRRGLFAIFFAFAVPFALLGIFAAGGMSYSILVYGPDFGGTALGLILGASLLFLGAAAFGACCSSLLAAGKGEERLVRVLWIFLALTVALLTGTVLLLTM